MLTEMVEYGRKIEEKMKAMKSEIKEKVQGTISEGKETGTQINSVEQKEETNIPPEQNEEIRIQKNEDSLRNLQDNFKHSNIQITGVPEEEEEDQEMENLFENIMKENFPNQQFSKLFFKLPTVWRTAKRNRLSEVQEAQRVPKKLDPRKHTPRHIIITLAKIKQKERILEAAREKDTVTYKGVPIRLLADFSKETLQAKRGWKEVFKVMKDRDLQPR